jgi:DNA-binding MarR family transcriptional regulator
VKEFGQYLPYLLNRAGSRVALAFGRELREVGITLQHWRVLAVLRESDGLRIGQLAAFTSINLSTLSRVVDNMERLGLVRRRADKSDTRVVNIHATAAGHEAMARILPLADKYENVALAGFTDAEAADLRAMLIRVFANMDGLATDAEE